VHPRPCRSRRPRLHAPRCPSQAARLAQITAEVLAGERAPDQIAGLVAPRAYALLRRRAGAYRCRNRPRVRSAWLRPAGPGAAELGAVVEVGHRRRALAIRVARHPEGWLCTHIEGDFGRC